ncbi:MAG TPA: DUF1203 domain-containing protein [Rhizomicrobium sp.]|jgi:hypothetical protein|nr:DUF1203 domain-containing protein [Rhizomicrobium sp.]
MPFRFTGLPLSDFQPLFGLSDAELAARDIVRVTADAKPNYPCRVTLENAEPGETLLLLAYEHQPAHSPYRSAGPIFVRESARTMYDGQELPPVFRGKMLSVRAYDGNGMMVEADVVAGDEAEPTFTRFLGREDVAYLHVHNAKRGCYAAKVERYEA